MRETVETKASRLAPLLKPGWVTLKDTGRRYRAYRAPSSSGTEYVTCAEPAYCSCAHFVKTNGRGECSHIKAARLRREQEERPATPRCPGCNGPLHVTDDDGLCFGCWVDRETAREDE